MEAPLGRLLSEHSPVGWRCHDGPADREAALLLDDQSDDVVLARCALGAAQPTATMTAKPTTRRQHAVSAPDHLLQLLRVACAVDFSAAHSYLPAARDAQWPSAALRSVGAGSACSFAPIQVHQVEISTDRIDASLGRTRSRVPVRSRSRAETRLALFISLRRWSRGKAALPKRDGRGCAPFMTSVSVRAEASAALSEKGRGTVKVV